MAKKDPESDGPPKLATSDLAWDSHGNRTEEVDDQSQTLAELADGADDATYIRSGKYLSKSGKPDARTPGKEAALATIMRVTVEIAGLREFLGDEVHRAIAYGATWAQVGEAAGISAQAAHKRWAVKQEEWVLEHVLKGDLMLEETEARLIKTDAGAHDQLQAAHAEAYKLRAEAYKLRAAAREMLGEARAEVSTLAASRDAIADELRSITGFVSAIAVPDRDAGRPSEGQRVLDT